MPSSNVMHEFKHGQLHSGSKSGPVVKSPAQAKAILMSEKRNEAAHGGTYTHKGKGAANTHGPGKKFVKKAGAAPRPRKKEPPHASPGADHIRNATMRGVKKPY